MLHLGCGIDSRVYRFDPPVSVRWFDVDYPEVFELRKCLYPERKENQMAALLKFLMYLLVVAPICTTLHEAGHAGMILLLTNQKVTFQFGARGTRREIRWGRLTIIVYVELGASFCVCRLENRAGMGVR